MTTTHNDIDAALYAWRDGEISLGKLRHCLRCWRAGESYQLPPLGEISLKLIAVPFEMSGDAISGVKYGGTTYDLALVAHKRVEVA